MSMALHRPAGRPAHMDNFFRDAPVPQSAHSSMSSISTSSSVSNYNPRNTTYSGRSLSPPPEESISDTSSIHSKTGSRDKKWYKMGNIMHRRTYPLSQEVDRATAGGRLEPSAEFSNEPVTRRPSLPKVLEDFPPPQAVSTYAKRPLPAVPPQTPLRKRPSLMRQTSAPLQSLQTTPDRKFSIRKHFSEKHIVSTQELSCQRCYYFTARNCNGYVLGGEEGDACEGCLQSGFFGAK